jgi:Uma2 family endonuclease
MSLRPEPWVVDQDDPRAPPEEIWSTLSEEQRQLIVDSLPSEFPPNEAAPPEGDLHTEAVYGARTALRRFFGKMGRGIYVGTNLPVYYPGRSMFSPDVIAVLDVATQPRPSWIVSKEGKGLDFALEVIVLGSRRKDVERNVELYARLGISEYFIFDRPKLRLQGFRLRAGTQAYEPVVPQHGHFASAVLGLDLLVERERLRFYLGDSELPGADDLIDKLEVFVDDLEGRLATAENRAEEESRRAEEEARRAEEEARRAEEEARRAEEEARRAEEEARRADEEARRAQQEARRAESAEARLKDALAELERLKRETR